MLLLRAKVGPSSFSKRGGRAACRDPAHTAYYDQGHLQQMLMENVLNLQAHTRIVTPCCRLNRCDDNGTDVCEFVLHLWGLQPKRREEIFSLIIEGKKPDIGIEMPRFNVASE